MEIYELPNKDFKIIILKKFSEPPENKDRQLNEIGKTIHEKSSTKREKS